VHVEVRYGAPKFQTNLHLDNEEKYILLYAPLPPSRVVEALTLLLLLFALLSFRLRGKTFDLYLFHIAYPLLAQVRLLKRILNKPMAILEHWTAYQKGFNLPEGSPGRRRIGEIFHHQIPLLTVSEALRDDIVEFCGTDTFDQYLVPNVISEDIFYPRDRGERKAVVFLTVANWSSPNKRLMLVVEAFHRLCQAGEDLQLRIAGEGEQLLDARAFLANHPETLERVTFLGNFLDPTGLAEEMANADALLHPTAFETFSLVCAESLFCETPVLASNVEPIPTFVGEMNGMLIENNVDSWEVGLREFLGCRERYRTGHLGDDVRSRFNGEAVAGLMKQTFETILERWKA